MPAWPRATRWCWSTTAAPAARSCWTWRGGSRLRWSSASGWRSSRSRGSWERAGEHGRRGRSAEIDAAVPEGRRPDAAQRDVLRADGGGDPDRLRRRRADGRDRLLPQRLRAAGAAAVPAPQRARGVPHATAAALLRALRDRRGLDAVRLLGDRQPADGAGDLAVLLGAAVRDHLRGDLAGRGRPQAPLDRGGAGLHRRAGD